MRWYCPGCWRDFGEDLARCPHCGLDIHAFCDSKDFVDKLIVALNHPEPTTPVRAAYILGRLRDERAVARLIALVQQTGDVFIARAAVEALGRIGTPAAHMFLRTLSTHPAQIVQEAARAALTLAIDPVPAASDRPLTKESDDET
jgi:HEAT repeat protein